MLYYKTKYIDMGNNNIGQNLFQGNTDFRPSIAI